MNKVAATFLENDGQFLILLRSDDSTHPNKWGLPAGKVEGEEDYAGAAARETFEETGLKIPLDQLHLIGVYKFGTGDGEYEIAPFRVTFEQLPEIKLNPAEHKGYKWVTPNECYKMQDLMPDFHEALVVTGYVTML